PTGGPEGGFGGPFRPAPSRGNAARPAAAAPPPSKRGGPAKRAGVDLPEGHATVEFSGETYHDVGPRCKGNGTLFGSMQALKKPMKLDFKQFMPKRRFHGVKMLNLNNNTTDPSRMREALSYQLFRQAGIPSPRTGYARVYLTVPGKYQRQYLGLYTLVE